MIRKEVLLRMKDKKFSAQVQKIREHFKTYSFEDVWKSLYVSNLWIRNISSQLKHILFHGILLSIPRSEFLNQKRISSYEDFSVFLKELYALAPQFITHEDYIPEPDWDEVQYHFKDVRFRIFYGGLLENTYDYIALFETVYCGFDEEYTAQTGRSPVEELKEGLGVQDHIISHINTNRRDIDEIRPGYTEVPSADFWQQVITYLETTPPNSICSTEFQAAHGVELGSMQVTDLAEKTFIEKVMSDKFITAMFIRSEGRYFNILPRQIVLNLIVEWKKLYDSIGNTFRDHGMRYSMRVTTSIIRFLKDRFQEGDFLPLVNALKSDKTHHETVFAGALKSKKRLFLLYVTDPVSDPEKTKEELTVLSAKIDEAIKLISGPPVILNLNLERKFIQYGKGSTEEALEVIPLLIVPQLQIQFAFEYPAKFKNTILFLDQFLGLMDEVNDIDELSDFYDFVKDLRSRPLAGMGLMNTVLDMLSNFRGFHGSIEPGANRAGFIAMSPHVGSYMRLANLSKFWAAFPRSLQMYNPRSWRLEEADSEKKVLISRGYRGLMFHVRVGEMDCFSTSPFMELPYEQGKIAELLAEIIQDVLLTRASIIGGHPFFHNFYETSISVFPWPLVKENPKFKHLKHLRPGNSLWRIEHGVPQAGFPVIRLVYNEKKVLETFSKVTDSSLEIDLLIAVLERFNQLSSDPSFGKIVAELNATKSRKNRFKITQFEKETSVPELWRSIKVSERKKPSCGRSFKRCAPSTSSRS